MVTGSQVSLHLRHVCCVTALLPGHFSLVANYSELECVSTMKQPAELGHCCMWHWIIAKLFSLHSFHCTVGFTVQASQGWLRGGGVCDAAVRGVPRAAAAERGGHQAECTLGGRRP